MNLTRNELAILATALDHMLKTQLLREHHRKAIEALADKIVGGQQAEQDWRTPSYCEEEHEECHEIRGPGVGNNHSRNN